VFFAHHYKGPNVNLDRPELSPRLSRVKKDSKTYNQLLAAIRESQRRVQARPRGDVMDGFVPYSKDAARLAHRKKYAEYERLVREAIREGRELYDSDFVSGKLGAK